MRFPYGALGTEHVVDNVRDGYVHLKAAKADGWCDFRFELIERKHRDYVADHARRTLRRAGFSKEAAKAFVKAHSDFARYGSAVGVTSANALDLSTLSRKLPKPGSEMLMTHLWWSHFAEGSDYWTKIYNDLVVFEKELNEEA